MTIKTRLLSLALAFALIASVITGMAIKTMQDNRSVIHAYTQASQNVLRGERLNRYLVSIAVELRGLYMAKTREETLWRADRVDQNVDKLNALIGDWYTHVKPGELPELDTVRERLKPALSGSQNLARLGRDVSREAAEAAGNHDSFRANREDMQAVIDTMISRLEGRLKVSRENLDRFESERIQVFGLIAGGGICLLLGGAWWVAAGMAARLRQVRRSIVSISEGAYDTTIPSARTGDEIGEIWGSLRILKDRAEAGERLTREKLEAEHKLRELVLD
jgi:HAMP domain-containing protein